jgi:hypothetical protein
VPCDYEEESSITVPITSIPCSDDRHQELQRLIDPLRSSENYGIDILLDVMELINY